MKISAEILIKAYEEGYFPMAEHAQDEEYQFIQPYVRALLPIETLHVSKSLKRKINKAPFDIRINTAFKEVIQACAARKETWINQEIIRLFLELNEKGRAHSVECWKDECLVGGLYGLTLGQAFCGESMFSYETDASKVALVHLCARLSAGGFTLLDAQFHNPHLEQFGLYEIPHTEYMAALHAALQKEADFNVSGMKERDLLELYFFNQK